MLHLPSEDDDDDENTPSRTVTQSMAMLRYAGKLAGLYPMDADLALTVDEVVDVVNNDVMPALEVQQDSSDRFVREIVPRYVDVLDRRVGETSEGGPFVLGDHVSIADLMICKLVNAVRKEEGTVSECGVPKECVDHCEHLVRSYDSVMSIPEVKDWYQARKIPNVTE